VRVPIAPVNDTAALDVMLLEDDVDTRESIREFLELLHYSVAAYGDAREALDAFARRRPSLLLLDLHLEEMCGWDFVAEQKRRGLAPVPTVVVSGLRKAEVNATLLGAVEVLRKPLDLDRLQEIVVRFCGRGGEAAG
jgi:two-component system, NtrC family, nitrogen regulation response regulator NtrX